MIRVDFDCPECGAEIREDDAESLETLRCHACGWTDRPSEEAIQDGRIVRCSVCGTEELYLQKDFPQRIGVAIVVSGMVLATIAWAYYQWTLTFAILIGFFLIDLALFHSRPDVTVCYRCLAQYRGMANDPDRKAFDLAIGEKYRQERLRKAERT